VLLVDNQTKREGVRVSEGQFVGVQTMHEMKRQVEEWNEEESQSLTLRERTREEVAERDSGID